MNQERNEVVADAVLDKAMDAVDASRVKLPEALRNALEQNLATVFRLHTNWDVLNDVLLGKEVEKTIRHSLFETVTAENDTATNLVLMNSAVNLDTDDVVIDTVAKESGLPIITLMGRNMVAILYNDIMVTIDKFMQETLQKLPLEEKVVTFSDTLS